MKYILKQSKIPLKGVNIILVLFISISLSSCDKPTYCDETGYCDLLMRDSGWEIDSLKIDGIDSLAAFMQHPYYCNTYKFVILTNNHYLIGNECNSGSIEPNTLGGGWSLLNKENFSLYFFDNPNISLWKPLFDTGEWWSVSELTDQYLKIKITFQNKTYEVAFKAK